MIKIGRKILNVKMNSYYFAADSCEFDRNVHLKAFTHSFVPMKNLSALDTLQIDLTKEQDVLLKEMHRTTRRQIRRATEQNLEQVIIKSPTDQDLKAFQLFYNRFAKDKKTFTCNSFHMKTMKLLRENDRLLLTYMKNNLNEIICYRVYIIDGHFTMNLYSASHFRLTEHAETKKLLSQANRYFIWKSVLYFKTKGYKIYDMGGLTNDENIRKFKLGFGGEVAPVYSGYEAVTMIGAMVLKIRNWKMALATAKERI